MNEISRLEMFIARYGDLIGPTGVSDLKYIHGMDMIEAVEKERKEWASYIPENCVEVRVRARNSDDELDSISQVISFESISKSQTLILKEFVLTVVEKILHGKVLTKYITSGPISNQKS